MRQNDTQQYYASKSFLNNTKLLVKLADLSHFSA